MIFRSLGVEKCENRVFFHWEGGGGGFFFWSAWFLPLGYPDQSRGFHSGRMAVWVLQVALAV